MFSNLAIRQLDIRRAVPISCVMLRRSSQRRIDFANWLYATMILFVVACLMIAGGSIGHAHSDADDGVAAMHHAVSDSNDGVADCDSGKSGGQHDQGDGMSCCGIGLGHCNNAWNSAAEKLPIPSGIGQKCSTSGPELLQGLSPDVEPKPPRKSVV